jgi:hypothetical protein
MPDLDLDLHDLRGAGVALTLDGQSLTDALNARDLARAQELARAIADRADAFVEVLGAPAASAAP